MSDQDLQELARRWRESGRVEDEAAWLRGRVRSGQLAPDRLAMAAFMGHEAAWLAMDASQELVDVLLATARWVVEEVKLALADRGIEGADQTTRILAAVDAFRDCPCDRHARECQLLSPLGPGSREFSPAHWFLSTTRSGLRPHQVAFHARRSIEEGEWLLGGIGMKSGLAARAQGEVSRRLLQYPRPSL